MDGGCLRILFLFAVVGPAPCAAQDSASAEKPFGVLAASSIGDSANGVLVLTDGKLLRGKFTPRPSGYDVLLPAGRLFVGSERVRFFAKDVPEAYGQMRASESVLSPERHMLLARWCLENDLPLEARREALDALRLDPNRSDARRLLQVLVSDSIAAGDPLPGSGLTEYPSTREITTTPTETRSLAGFSRAVAQDFTRHLQPLLMNKCASAGCHGGENKSEFVLASAHRGSSPAIAERNLAAVLKQIDFEHPEQSRILAASDGAHGGQNESFFRGRSGSQQLAMLRNWVFSVVGELSPETPSHPTTLIENDVVLVSGGSGASQRIQTAGGENAATIPHARKLHVAETDRRFLAEAIRANAQDAFDPSAFNRRFHAQQRQAADSEKLAETADDRMNGGVP